MGRVRSAVAGHGFGLGVYAGCQLVLLAWWLAFFPVLVTPDSITYVHEATTNNWATDHSVVYDALIWLSLEATRGVATLTFLQTAAMAAVLAYIANGLRLLGARAVVAGAVPVMVLLAPSLGSFPVYLWKDVPFALCSLWLLGLVIRLVLVVQSEDDWVRHPRSRALYRWMFVATLLMCLSRNNAFVFAVITVVALLLLWRGRALRLTAAVLAGVVVAIGLTVAVFPALGVHRAKSDLVLGPAYDDIAYVYQRESKLFSATDRSLLVSVAPLQLWRHAGNCYTADDLTNSPYFSRDAASSHSSELFALWRRLLVNHPVAIAKARLCRGYIAWSPVPAPKRKGQTVFPITAERPERFLFIPNPTWRRAVMPAPIDAGYRKFAQVYVVRSRPDEWAIWRGATWIYVLYASVLFAAIRTRRWSLLALAAVPLGVQLGVIVDNPNQLVRYMIMPLYAGPALLPLVTVRRRRPDVAAAGPAPTEVPAETPPEHPPGRGAHRA